MESNGVGVVEGNGSDVVAVGSLAEVQDTLDLLVELVGWPNTLVYDSNGIPSIRLTGVLGLGDNLGKKLSEVREIVLEEAGADDEGLAGVAGGQLATEELRFAVDAEGRSFLGVLRRLG